VRKGEGRGEDKGIRETRERKRGRGREREKG